MNILKSLLVIVFLLSTTANGVTITNDSPVLVTTEHTYMIFEPDSQMLACYQVQAKTNIYSGERIIPKRGSSGFCTTITQQDTLSITIGTKTLKIPHTLLYSEKEDGSKIATENITINVLTREESPVLLIMRNSEGVTEFFPLISLISNQ